MRRRSFITLLGGAAAWPLAARAQQQAMPAVGFVSSSNAQSTPHITAAFLAGLKENGFSEGENVAIEYRWADGDLERLPSLVADLVRRRVSVIFSTGGDVPTLVAKGATTTIPIVFATGADPLRSGLVVSLKRPSGNATGVTASRLLVAASRQLAATQHFGYFRSGADMRGPAATPPAGSSRVKDWPPASFTAFTFQRKFGIEVRQRDGDEPRVVRGCRFLRRS